MWCTHNNFQYSAWYNNNIPVDLARRSRTRVRGSIQRCKAGDRKYELGLHKGIFLVFRWVWKNCWDRVGFLVFYGQSWRFSTVFWKVYKLLFPEYKLQVKHLRWWWCVCFSSSLRWTWANKFFFQNCFWYLQTCVKTIKTTIITHLRINCGSKLTS